MKITLLVVVLAVSGFVGEWTYRSFFRPIDPLQPEVMALAQHMNRGGIQVEAYAVRHGFKHTEVTAGASFQIKDYPLSVSIIICPTTATAEEFLRRVETSPNLMHPRQNHRLVMYLPMWGEDTEAMAQKVQNAFTSFQFGT